MFICSTRRLLPSLQPKLSSLLLLRNIQNDEVLKRYHFNLAKHSRRKDINPGSKYAPRSNIEVTEENVLEKLRNKTSMNAEEWDDLKSELFENSGCVSEDSFGPIVMNALLFSNQLDLSHSFMGYLEQSTFKPNFLTYLKYLSLCSKNFRLIDQAHIIRTINKVKGQLDKSPVIDMKRAEYIIEGLCATDRWRESFDYLSKLTNKKPSNVICSTLACASIRNGDENLAWDILMNWISCYEAPLDKVVKEFLLVALSLQRSNAIASEKLVLKLFSYMEEHSVIISSDVAKLVEQYFKCHRLKWNITYTKVNRKGICASCEHNLKPSVLDDNEFKTLSKAFLQKVVMKSDIFINTNRKEFDHYMKFINTHKPFHIVLDGLNAAYSYHGSIRNKKKLSHHLLHIVQILSGKSRKLFILGKKHMQSWPKFEMINISQRVKLFFTDNISQDDPFAIYSALASGPHTLFLSDDLMRDHLSRLEDPKLIHLFKKWQLSHQMYLQCDDANTIKFIEPVRHSIASQGNLENGWHIPFDDKVILDPYEELNNWLCIKRIP